MTHGRDDGDISTALVCHYRANISPLSEVAMKEEMSVREPGDDALDRDPQDKHGEAGSFAPPPVPRNPGSRSLRRLQCADFNGGGGNRHARTAIGIRMFELFRQAVHRLAQLSAHEGGAT